MFEVTLLLLIAVAAFLLWENKVLFTRNPHQQTAVACDAGLDLGLEDPADKENFLVYLQNEIESALPWPELPKKHPNGLRMREIWCLLIGNQIGK